MPETMSVERRSLLKAYGADIVLTEGAKGMNGAIAKAKEIAAVTPGAFIPGNLKTPPIRQPISPPPAPKSGEDTDGGVDIFVAGIGTGGTITGVGRFLKTRNPQIQIVGIEPADSPVLSGGRRARIKIQGIGAGFVPATLDRTVLDDVLTVTNEDAFAAGRAVAKEEGILVGISSGAAIAGAARLARRPENTGKRIVVLLPDTGDRYLSTPLFADA